MPAVRLSRRRRTSLGKGFIPAKAGIYGFPQRPVTFAPNVTPVTFNEPESASTSATPPTSTLFPPLLTPAPPPARKRVPPGKRRSQGYIPRPPNAFMLFRADFVHQKHLTIEATHGSLSKIIGNCWRSLHPNDKKFWENRANQVKAEHKALYPHYRFRPVHNKNKDKKKDKPVTTIAEERRCEAVAQLLLTGMKGEELAAAVHVMDDQSRSESPAIQTTYYHHRRSSSVPLPNDYHNIAIPSIPFLSNTRPLSPMGYTSQHQHHHQLYLPRRPSSAGAMMTNRLWSGSESFPFERDDSPLPEVDTSLFEQAFLQSNGNNFSFPTNDNRESFDVNELLTSLPPNAPPPSHHNQGPLDGISPHDILSQQMYQSTTYNVDPVPEWVHSQTNSQPSTSYSGSPAPSDGSLPILHAPQPQHAELITSEHSFNEMWQEFGSSYPESQHYENPPLNLGLGLDLGQHENLMGCGVVLDDHHYAQVDGSFDPQPYNPMYNYEFHTDMTLPA